ncbi:hypothetical protein HK096_007707 [Nowakowskiella sp. JEL0078]|nr:hypothetical protein HK096_007707 [Nowakowskiella sp. JEL0078]
MVGQSSHLAIFRSYTAFVLFNYCSFAALVPSSPLSPFYSEFSSARDLYEQDADYLRNVSDDDIISLARKSSRRKRNSQKKLVADNEVFTWGAKDCVNKDVNSSHLPSLISPMSRFSSLLRSFHVIHPTASSNIEHILNCIKQQGLSPSPAQLLSALNTHAANLSLSLSQQTFSTLSLSPVTPPSIMTMACNIMILLYGRSESTMPLANEIFDLMRYHKYPPTKMTFDVLMLANNHAQRADTTMIRLCLDEMRSTGFAPDLFSYRIALAGFARGGAVDDIVKLLCEIRDDGAALSPRDVSRMLNTLVDAGFVSGAEGLITIIERKSLLKLSSADVNIVVRGWGIARLPERALQIVEAKLPKNQDSESIMLSTLMYAFGRNGKLDEAKRIEKQVKVKGTVHYSALVASYSKQRDLRKARSTISEMLDKNIKPTNFVFCSYFDAVCSSKLSNQEFRESIVDLLNLKFDFKHSYAVHSILKHSYQTGGLEQLCKVALNLTNSGFDFNTASKTFILNAHRSLGIKKVTELVYPLFQTATPPLQACNLLLTMYGDMGDLHSVLSLYGLMRFAWNHTPNSNTFRAIFRGCARTQQDAKQVIKEAHAEMEACNVRLDVYLAQEELVALSRYGDMADVKDLLARMAHAAIPVDKFHFCSVLATLCRFGEADSIRHMLEDVGTGRVQLGFGLDSEMCTTLMRAYMQCNNLTGMVQAFRDTVSGWGVAPTKPMVAVLGKAFVNNHKAAEFLPFLESFERNGVIVDDNVRIEAYRFVFAACHSVREVVELLVYVQDTLAVIPDIKFFNAAIHAITRIRNAAILARPVDKRRHHLPHNLAPGTMYRLATMILERIGRTDGKTLPSMATFSCLANMCTAREGCGNNAQRRTMLVRDAKYVRLLHDRMRAEFRLRPDWPFLYKMVASAVRAGKRRVVWFVWENYVLRSLYVSRLRGRVSGGGSVVNRRIWMQRLRRMRGDEALDPRAQYSIVNYRVIHMLQAAAKMGRPDLTLKMWLGLKKSRFYHVKDYEDHEVLGPKVRELLRKVAPNAKSSLRDKFNNI